MPAAPATTHTREPIDWEKLCEGCGKCCGPIAFPPNWWSRNKHRALRRYVEVPVRGRIIPRTADLTCVFLTEEKRCLVYEERPAVCRLQGTHPKLPCPRLDPEATARRKEELLRQYGVR